MGDLSKHRYSLTEVSFFFLKTKWGLISFADWKKAKKLWKYISFFLNCVAFSECHKLIERFHNIVFLIFDYFINFIREGNKKPLHMIEYKEINSIKIVHNTIIRSSLLLFTLETIAMSFFLCVLVLALDSKSKFVRLRMHDIGINDGINICFVLCW